MKKIPIECIRPGHAWAFSVSVSSLISTVSSPPRQPFTAASWPRAQTRAGKGCRSRGLSTVSICSLPRDVGACVPGPLTLRMMLRVVSSMNSTRHWVTPPREPVQVRIPSSCILSLLRIRRRRTGTAENAGDLDELDGDLGGIHCERLHGSARAKRYGGLRRRAYCGKSGDWWVVGVRVWC